MGILLDDRLGFKSHINTICSKARKRINILSKVRYFLPKHVLKTIYKAIVLPIFDYCICVYGFTYPTYLARIESLQRRAVHVIMSSDSSHFQLYEDLGWKPYIKRRNYFCYIFIYKCVNKLAANMCHNLFKVKTSEIKTKWIRNKELFYQNLIQNVFKTLYFIQELNCITN